ncbi:uncharacterized protein PGRI_012490 [Penicillium griseofulvum]|uniref:Uncharacterized protein n=1 Tax=Penicillium patulum TaxID=5078 RepID=A0A135LEJ4_PENPA|nr:uncharacterized protein PGRI_012490 [Penicillium griseofulvum]KXG47379.1 hypothetical protein PGRI_012490 [Penicillium griseofulvum]
MNRTSEHKYPQPPGSTQLGNFAKLPLEIRLMIWENLFYDIHAAPHILSILRCNSHLYQEISSHVYSGMKHEIRISSTKSLKWLYVRLISKRMPAKWRGLENIKAVQKHLTNFPHDKIKGKEIFVNIILSSRNDIDQMMQLEDKANRLVDILEAVPVVPTVLVSLLEENAKYINYTEEVPPEYKFWTIPFMGLSNWHFRVSMRLSDVVTSKRKDPDCSLMNKPIKDEV